MTTAALASDAAAAGPLRAVLGSPGLRRIVGGWTFGIAGDAAMLVALLVITYQSGGPLAVGILGVVRMAPSVVAAPLAAGPASRHPPTRLLLIVQLVRALASIATVVIIVAGAWLPALFLASAVGATAGTLVRPLQASALPSLTRTPGELVAANAAISTGEGLGGFGGPLLAGLLMAAAGPLAATVASTVMFGVATLSMVGLGASADDAAEVAAERRAREALEARRESGGLVAGLTAGLRVVRHRPGPAALLADVGSQVVTRGLMNTLITVAALGLIGLGDSGVGILNSAWGLGGLLGALAAVGLASRQRLGPWFAFSMVLWGLPLAIIGALPLPLIALGAMFASGVGNATLDVSVFTLLQRSVRSADRMAVFVLLEAIAALGIAVGSILGPLLLAVFGDRGALVVAGAIMPVAIIATWGRVRRVDEEAVVPAKELSILRGIPMFARLPLTARERLAEGMRSAVFAP
ncbi:MAG TPA: MFS transporter, partial [Candidatus Saccharimonadia bacterium]|nr:MFS transporter [Candidatus Saccharimonadia bacterium]